jgi:hypothetical protein
MLRLNGLEPRHGFGEPPKRHEFVDHPQSQLDRGRKRLERPFEQERSLLVIHNRSRREDHVRRCVVLVHLDARDAVSQMLVRVTA